MRIVYEITNQGRQCTGCKVFLSWERFSKNKNGTNGHQSCCKECWSNTHTKNHTDAYKGRTKKEENEELILEYMRREDMTEQELRQEYLERKREWRKEWDRIDWPTLHRKVYLEVMTGE